MPQWQVFGPIVLGGRPVEGRELDIRHEAGLVAETTRRNVARSAVPIEDRHDDRPRHRDLRNGLTDSLGVPALCCGSLLRRLDALEGLTLQDDVHSGHRLAH